MANVNDQSMGRKGARRFVARLAIGGGLRREGLKQRGGGDLVREGRDEAVGLLVFCLRSSCVGERDPKGVWEASRATAAMMTWCSVGLLDGRGRGSSKQERTEVDGDVLSPLVAAQ
uniref:Uncharacterized protein n=1 Tax=Lactuca sativa TaxID=4236 RepID=A0A9R1UK79_LACSA|nr:hypothetical protein LSAT_V11C900501390 [Lactuca sativa]